MTQDIAFGTVVCGVGSGLVVLGSSFLVRRSCSLGSLFEAAQGSTLAFVGGSGAPRAEERPRQSRYLARFDLFWSWRRGQICVKFAGFGLRQVLLGQGSDDHALTATEWSMYDDLVANPELTVGLGWLAVDVNLSILARLLGFGSGPKKTRDIEPEIEPHAWFLVRGSSFVVLVRDFLVSSFMARRSRLAVRCPPVPSRAGCRF
jgi:hypothetical protein